MYSKKIYLSALFCIILYFAPGSAYDDESDRNSYDYYDVSCPNLQMIVSLGVWKAIQNDTRMAASLLRLHYLDCFVDGCEGSVLLDDTKTFKGEQNALPNRHSIRGLDDIDSIKSDVEFVCPSIVSCADILALAARDAVVQSGGLFWDVLLGRLDGVTASEKSVMEQLPSPFESLENIVAKFAAKGLNIKDMVVLSGAHTIGLAQCFMYRGRLYNFNGTGNPDPSLNPKLLSKLQSTCTKDEKTSCNLAALDTGGIANKFDSMYYKNVMKSEGLLQSDQALMTGPKTRPMVKVYGADSRLFLKHFAVSMAKLGNISVIRNRGEIRKKCGSVN